MIMQFCGKPGFAAMTVRRIMKRCGIQSQVHVEQIFPGILMLSATISTRDVQAICAQRSCSAQKMVVLDVVKQVMPSIDSVWALKVYTAC